MDLTSLQFDKILDRLLNLYFNRTGCGHLCPFDCIPSILSLAVAKTPSWIDLNIALNNSMKIY
jgi:hypothetical protein